MPPKKSQLPPSFPEGLIVTDTEKKTWRLGKIIGQGGFGLIYLASNNTSAPVAEDADFVIKVEYYENGSLFSELKFYQRAAKHDCIKKWMKNKKLPFLGIPCYWGSGLAEFQGKRYRFMVMDRLGCDLQKLFEENGKKFKWKTVLQLGVQMLDVLEYIHENEYIHGDIKAANLLLCYKDPSKVFLADYGLSYRYSPNGTLKEYKEDPKTRHNGTMEYTSIDAHKGVAPSRRGDLEILGYCLLHWMCGKLPWEKDLKKPLLVQEAKTELMENLPGSVIQCSSPGANCGEIARFLSCVKTLEYDERPNYQMLEDILLDGLRKAKTDYRGPLDFSTASELEAHGSKWSNSVTKPKSTKPKPRNLEPTETSESSEYPTQTHSRQRKAQSESLEKEMVPLASGLRRKKQHKPLHLQNSADIINQEETCLPPSKESILIEWQATTSREVKMYGLIIPFLLALILLVVCFL
ncbi:serine/threonine-protein kinase VRK1-like isoform X1 [Acipenser oxyrinchus oxyrinchus]|uniref:non-specific serine/threonine protein kinase n=1 Tax=Acipenser oxyrinchus oxyrinchus TaxID=40147 RepID=A0AAD8LP70_ACIOX|nr:serine/threonine-protein kinase VRK1-like isoform X1 [Acipenser oxyrinchus oxyrinchus]